MKLVLELPDPSPLTPEDMDRLRAEAAEWRAQFARDARKLETLTPEDWRATAR